MANKKKVSRQFLMLDYALIHGPLWNGLSRSSRDVYEQIKSSRHTKSKSGKVKNTDDSNIEFGYSDLNKWCNISRTTFYSCIKELRAKGFIDVVEYGSFPGIDAGRKKTTYSLSKKWMAYNYAMINKDDDGGSKNNG